MALNVWRRPLQRDSGRRVRFVDDVEANAINANAAVRRENKKSLSNVLGRKIPKEYMEEYRYILEEQDKQVLETKGSVYRYTHKVAPQSVRIQFFESAYNLCNQRDPDIEADVTYDGQGRICVSTILNMWNLESCRFMVQYSDGDWREVFYSKHNPDKMLEYQHLSALGMPREAQEWREQRYMKIPDCIYIIEGPISPETRRHRAYRDIFASYRKFQYILTDLSHVLSGDAMYLIRRYYCHPIDVVFFSFKYRVYNPTKKGYQAARAVKVSLIDVMLFMVACWFVWAYGMKAYFPEVAGRVGEGIKDVLRKAVGI